MFEFGSVNELNLYVDRLFMNDGCLSEFTLTAEVSGFKAYPSGHLYFSLKDKDASVSCVMFRGNASRLDFTPRDGMRVRIVGAANVYNVNGKYQIKVFEMAKAGVGDLKEQFDRLLKKLNDEGLFDPSHKKPIPVLPKRIGVISSPKGAVIHDMLVRLKERNPHFDLLLYPAAVQGENCPKEVCEGISYFEETKKCDVIIIARGGGSLEDLWGFNDETLARKIYACPIPVISAIGHEVDYTISDYVADLRAATPTAAAELVIGKYSDMKDNIDNNVLLLSMAITNYIEARKRQLEIFKNHKALHSPMYYIMNQKEVLKNKKYMLDGAMKDLMNTRANEIGGVIERLDLLNPLNTLKRGYAVVMDDSSKVIEKTADVSVGELLKIKLSDGNISCEVKDIINTEA